MGSKPSIPKPTTPDYGKATGNLLGVYQQTTPGVQSFEASARPGYMGLNLGDIAAFLQGTGGQSGYISQTGQAATAAQQQLDAARAAEYGGMTSQAGQVRGLLGAISPEGQRMMQLQQNAAEQAYRSAQGLTGQEARTAQQAAREASMARGNIGSTGSVASEILNREYVLANKRAQAAQYGNQAYQTAQNFYSPALGLLGGSPASMALGQQYAQMGLSQVGQATPKLFDYSTAFGIENARTKAQDAYNQAKYQQQLQSYQSGVGAIGTLGGAALGFVVGGPVGAQMGAQLGGGIAGGLGGSSSSGGFSSFTPENYKSAQQFKGIFG